MILTISIVIAIGYWVYWDIQNPFDEIEFLIDHPGANGRYAEFTPVLRSVPTKEIGPKVGADFGVLKFQDWDGDGIHEAIVETDVPFFSDGEYYYAQRTVLKYTVDKSGLPVLKEIHNEKIEDAYSEGWKATYGN